MACSLKLDLSYNGLVLDSVPRSKWVGYAISVLATAGITAALAPFREQISLATVALSFLLLVLFTAIAWGRWPALLASILSVFSFNFFFIPPVHTLTIADPQNWVALIAFLITALSVGQLSAIARRRASEAEYQRAEIRRLYDDLQEAFERASEAEAIKRSEQLKSALLDAVTHDIRTPLTSIKASATLLLEDRESDEPVERLSPEEQHEILKVITHSADRLDRFVEGIVDLARITAGDINLHRNWGAVEDIVDAALAQAEPLTRKHRIELHIEEELPVVRVDARAVAEVIYALVDNASKYSPVGTTIHIEAKRAADDIVKIAVQDEGPGIPEDARKRVFEKFFRGTTDGSTGIGMGLAIAKGIVEAHGGRIWIEDPSGLHGARIAFTVPVGDDEPPPQHDNLAQSASAELVEES